MRSTRKRPPIFATEIPGNQVPAISGMHQPVRLYDARAWRPGAIVIVEPNAFMIAAGASDRREPFGVDCWPCDCRSEE